MIEIPNFHKIDEEELGAIIATVNNLVTRLKSSGGHIAFDKAVLVETEQDDYQVLIVVLKKGKEKTQ
jgi:hypothetical protein